MRTTYLVCYDISHPRRLAKVAKTLAGFGDRVQYSVFECQLTQMDLVRCQQLLSAVLNVREDQVMFVSLGPSDGRGDRVITTLGRPYTQIDTPCLIVDNDGPAHRARRR